MATAHINDLFIKSTNADVGILELDATGASRVSLSVTTQIGSGTATDLTASIEGSNDRGFWVDITDSGTASKDVGIVGSHSVLGKVSGFAWVRAHLVRVGGPADAFLISASLNTGA